MEQSRRTESALARARKITHYMRMRLAAFLLLLSSCAFAHPMGNFSVNHYCRFTPRPGGVELLYVLDLAEIPTFDLLRDWNLEATSPRFALEAKASQQASIWLDNLDVTASGLRVKPILNSVALVVADGAGNLPIIRITAIAHMAVKSGPLHYEDRNYPDRAGWKEIVIKSADGVALTRASHNDQDISEALTHYPPDPLIAPPQDLRAEFDWTAEPLVTSHPRRTPLSGAKRPIIVAIPQPHLAPAATSPALMTKQAAPLGSVVRGDSLSTILRQRAITPAVMLFALALAFLLGAAHALTPGHGKTIVAAYLVGSRGTMRHAVFLGAMVTFTHTIAVFALGLITLFLFRSVVPERITAILGAVSGLSIVAIGAWTMYKRLRPQHRVHAHYHHRPHDHQHAHQHGDEHHHGHTHSHAHGGHTHVPDEISWAGLFALGAGGGLVPCESALLLLLGAIAIGRVGFGLLLLLSFSLGLAMVLMAIGVIVLYAKSLLPERNRGAGSPFFRWAPVASSAVVVCIGFLMTAVSLGWIQSKWMI